MMTTETITLTGPHSITSGAHVDHDDADTLKLRTGVDYRDADLVKRGEVLDSRRRRMILDDCGRMLVDPREAPIYHGPKSPARPNRDIEVTSTPVGYMAIDRDRYDGAPDGDCTYGTGATPDEAVADLREKYRA
jgi:hypothetical protein